MNALVVASHPDDRAAGQDGLCLHPPILPHAGDPSWGEYRVTVLLSPACGGLRMAKYSVWNSLMKTWANRERRLRSVRAFNGSSRRSVQLVLAWCSALMPPAWHATIAIGLNC